MIAIYGDPEAKAPSPGRVLNRMISADLERHSNLVILVLSTAMTKTKLPRYAIVHRLQQERARQIRNELVEAKVLKSRSDCNITSHERWERISSAACGVCLVTI